MKLTEYTFKKKTFAYVMTLLLIGGGIWAYQGLGRLEFPVFTIKTAIVMTPYPGASALEVENEVTEPLETAIQQMAQVKEIRSISRAGLSIIFMDVKDEHSNEEMPQIWDELRRKVGDTRMYLPPGAGPSLVNDDFGDEYGVFLSLYGQGFTYKELKEEADRLRQKLLLVQDVASVEIYGAQPETIYLEIPRENMAKLGPCMPAVISTINRQGQVADAGRVDFGDDRIRIHPTGGLNSVEGLQNLLIRCDQTGEEIYLQDVARVKRGYQDPPNSLMRYQGQPALGIGISTTATGNVVTMGQNVRKLLDELSPDLPAGMELGTIAYQSETVTNKIQGFIWNLVAAVGIVIVVLCITMGLVSGVLMGVILLLTILGTFIIMKVTGVTLQIISLGALILALGMLVDNAIVVTEGILVRVKRGVPRQEAAMQTVKQTAWPLLGATIVAILAFAAIGTSQDTTGEFLGSLFLVMAYSLGLSWVLALTLTPLFCVQFLPSAKNFEGQDPYSGWFFQGYRRFLTSCLNHRITSIAVLLAVLAASLYGFSKVEQSFFPSSDRPQFMIDVWRPEGTGIRSTERDIRQIEAHVAQMDGVESTASFIGQGALRFLLTYEAEMPNTSYGQVLVTTQSYLEINRLVAELRPYLEENYPDAEFQLKRFQFGPGSGSKIEARFSGDDPDVLRELAEQAKAVMAQDPVAEVVRDDWRQRVAVLEPRVSETVARRTGITRPDVADALAINFTGKTVGLYREEDRMIPIVLRAPEDERQDADDLNDVQVFSPIAGNLPLNQVLTGVDGRWTDPIIRRLDRKRTITAQCDPRYGNASPLFQRLRPQIEAIELPPGYEMEWGGEFEDSNEANAMLLKMVPVFFLCMVLIVLAMFNSIRQTLVIFLCLPLATIGVAAGLLITGEPFSFNCLLGFLGLSGMLIKNAVVLIDQINLFISQGHRKVLAILDSSVSRVRPVLMASLTTILGMLPLVPDPFFSAMSITIVGGLAFGTVLTLVVVPVLYAAFYRAGRVGPLPAGQGSQE